MKPLQPWKTIASEECFNAAPWVKVINDTIELPSGRKVAGFYRVSLPEYVMICARDTSGKYILIRQYKHALKAVSFGLPAGGRSLDEEPLMAAKRELLEETGYSSSRWISLGTFMTDGHRGCSKANFFIAQDAEKTAQPRYDDTEEIETVIVPEEEIPAMVLRGDIPIVAAVALLNIAIHPAYQKKFFTEDK